MDAIHKAADFGNESNSENGEEEETSVAPISKAKEPSGKFQFFFYLIVILNFIF